MSYMNPDKPFKRAHVTSTPQRNGLDDGPELPSQAARDRAYAKIEAQLLITDAERINWLEKTKYLEIGIGWKDKHPQIEVRFREYGDLKRFFGRSLRAAIDEAMKTPLPEYPHASDCNIWVNEPCSCVTGKAE